jgi:hypothetical protein
MPCVRPALLGGDGRVDEVTSGRDMKSKLALLILLVLPWTCMATSHPQPEPEEAGMQKAQLCKPGEIDAVATFLNLPTLELKSDEGEPSDSILVTAACKVNPATPRQTIIAVAYDTGKKDSKALSIVLLDNVHQRVMADYRGEIAEDPLMSIETGSLWIDTADYALAEGVRAFAVDEISGYRATCGDGGVGPSRYLYVREGKRIQPVLSGLDMSYWEFIRRGVDLCNSQADPDARTIIGNTAFSLAVAPTSSHGYRDLLVTAEFSRDDGKPVHNYFNNNPCGLPFDYLLHYDGKRYRTDGLQKALFCGDRFQPLAIVVKGATASADSAKAAPVQFLPSMQVRILDRKPGALLVQRIGEPGRLGWMPQEALVASYGFKPLRTWKGPVTLHAMAESFGILGTYHLLPDGSYTIEFPNTREGMGALLSGRHFSGHLSAYGPVIEADKGPAVRRTSGNEPMARCV